MRRRGWTGYTSKLAFPREVFPPEDVRHIQERLHQAPPPRTTEGDRRPAPTRWSLAYLKAMEPLLQEYTLGGLWHLLRRLPITYRQGRRSVHSPDPDYERKRDYSQRCVAEARARPDQVVALFLDELSYYRQPDPAPCWWSEEWGSEQPRAPLSHHRNTLRRVVGALDAVRGRIVAAQGFKIGVKKLREFYAQLRSQYPRPRHIYLIQDNWPVHFHPQVLEAAQETEIEVVKLPTYAPWLNPIEKFWRKLRQDILHMHPLSDRWEELKQRIQDYLDSFAQGSQPLLRYVGLLPDGLPD